LVRCPKCAVEVDVDEDEVEEGEILNCPGCEAELEVVQIHPVKVNVISEDDEDEESEEDDDEDEVEAAVEDKILDQEEEDVE
jgi:lysine biosynthesis protein LysW